MFCKNCGKEIGDSRDCSYCGYNPIKDDNPNASADSSYSNVTVPPVKIVPIKKRNGMATAGFILSFFSFYFFPVGILSFIFSTIGFFKAKLYRSGRIKSLIGIMITFAWAAVWGLLIYLAIKGELG